jgi:hypothetical protein
MNQGLTMPTVEVDAGNDGPPSRRATDVNVAGLGFPPGTTVNIKVTSGAARALRGTAPVRADGSFEWSASFRPKLACQASVTAVTHGSDGIQATGSTDVFCPPVP